MTIEDARKVGELSRNLVSSYDALYAAKDVRSKAFGNRGWSYVSFDGYAIEKMIPTDIAEEALNLIIKRLAERYDKIKAEIEAL